MYLTTESHAVGLSQTRTTGFAARDWLGYLCMPLTSEYQSIGLCSSTEFSMRFPGYVIFYNFFLPTLLWWIHDFL